MGNCIRKGSSTEWGGEDWSSFRSEDKSRDPYAESTNYLTGREGKGDLSSTEVKIKISKKQLEEMLKKADIQGMSVQQVSAKLMNNSDEFEAHHRSWRPALQSIPE